MHFCFNSIGTVPPVVGEKLFIEEGKVEGFEGRDALREGVITKVAFTSNVKGVGDKFPSGKNQGLGTMTQHEDGIVDGSYEGSLMTDEGDQFMWRSHEMSKVGDDGKLLKGIEIVMGFSQSQKWARLNELIIVLETEMDLSVRYFSNTAYEWKSAVL